MLVELLRRAHIGQLAQAILLLELERPASCALLQARGGALGHADALELVPDPQRVRVEPFKRSAKLEGAEMLDGGLARTRCLR